MVFTGNISPEKYAYGRLLLEERGWSIRKVAKRLRISKSSVHRLKHRDFCETRRRHVKKRGRPCKLSPRDKRHILRCVEELRHTEGTFTVEQLMNAAEIPKESVSVWTVRKYLNDEDIKYLNTRQKGILTEEDRKKRARYCKQVRKDHPRNIWTEGIAFNLDGVNFVHKTRPTEQSRCPKKKTWRRRKEGLKAGCLAKGQKAGSGANIVRMMVAIAYKKGIIICEEYEKLNGAYFADFVRRNFVGMFGAADKDHVKYFLQDGDRSQNSKVALEALKRVKAEVFHIPAKSPDLNPIENVFHLANRELKDSSKRIKIGFKSRENFVRRIRRSLHSVPLSTIDKTIASMDKRVGMIIRARGERIKY